MWCVESLRWSMLVTTLIQRIQLSFYHVHIINIRFTSNLFCWNFLNNFNSTWLSESTYIVASKRNKIETNNIKNLTFYIENRPYSLPRSKRMSSLSFFVNSSLFYDATTDLHASVCKKSELPFFNLFNNMYNPILSLIYINYTIINIASVALNISNVCFNDSRKWEKY